MARARKKTGTPQTYPNGMTKKQMKLAEEEAAIMAEAMKKLAESQEDDEEVIEFGESVVNEEE